MNVRSAAMWWGWPLSSSRSAGRALVVSDDDDAAAGFEGYIQSGTCAQPTDDFKVDLESEDDAYDVEPYVAVGADGEPVTLGYYGAPGVPGFGLAAIYTDQQFSMVITDPDTDEAVACGDILRPDADEFEEAGLALVQLLPVGSSDVQGIAAIERATPPARAGHHADPGPDHPLHRPRQRAGRRGGRVRGLRPGRAVRVAGPGTLHVELEERGRPRRRARSRPAPPRRATPSPSPTTDRPAHLASGWPRPTPTRTSRW